MCYCCSCFSRSFYLLLDLNTTPIIGFDMRGFMFSSSSIYGLRNGFSILKHSSRESYTINGLCPIFQ